MVNTHDLCKSGRGTKSLYFLPGNLAQYTMNLDAVTPVAKPCSHYPSTFSVLLPAPDMGFRSSGNVRLVIK